MAKKPKARSGAERTATEAEVSLVVLRKAIRAGMRDDYQNRSFRTLRVRRNRLKALW